MKKIEEIKRAEKELKNGIISEIVPLVEGFEGKEVRFDGYDRPMPRYIDEYNRECSVGSVYHDEDGELYTCVLCDGNEVRDLADILPFECLCKVCDIIRGGSDIFAVKRIVEGYRTIFPYREDGEGMVNFCWGILERYNRTDKRQSIGQYTLDVLSSTRKKVVEFLEGRMSTSLRTFIDAVRGWNYLMECIVNGQIGKFTDEFGKVDDAHETMVGEIMSGRYFQALRENKLTERYQYPNTYDLAKIILELDFEEFVNGFLVTDIYDIWDKID